MSVRLLSLLLFSLPLAALAQFAELGGISTERDQAIEFTELRMNGLLETPLQLHGHLLYGSDGSLTKRISEPIVETVTISATSVRMERNGKSRELSLRKAKALAEFYRALRALLDGDRSTINKMFDVHQSSAEEGWSFLLLPRDKSLQKLTSRLIVSGVGKQVLEIRIEKDAQNWQVLQLNMPPT